MYIPFPEAYFKSFGATDGPYSSPNGQEVYRPYSHAMGREGLVTLALRELEIVLGFTPYLNIPPDPNATDGIWNKRGDGGLWENRTEHGTILINPAERDFMFHAGERDNFQIHGKTDNTRIGSITLNKPLEGHLFEVVVETESYNGLAFLGDGTLSAFFQHVGYTGLDTLTR